MEESVPQPPEHTTRQTGRLFVLATPIGNLEDITVRALRVLGQADLIACEDTRHTAKLLNHYGIHRPTVSYHQHNEASRANELLERLQSGAQVALVSDAGTPVISDPGIAWSRCASNTRFPLSPFPALRP